MNRHLASMAFKARLPSDPADVILAFSGAGHVMCAAGTTGEPHMATVNGTVMTLTSRPVYLAV
jgi:hypothetical protein